MENPLTLVEHHFVRNRGGIPKCINPEKYMLEISGKVGKPISITLSELQDPDRFPQKKLAVTLQCCGTQRKEQIDLYPGHGLLVANAPWPEGAIGNAVYTGVFLKDILERACGGITLETTQAHAEFISADTYLKPDKPFNYAVNVPYRFVEKESVMLAWEMDGKVSDCLHIACIVQPSDRRDRLLRSLFQKFMAFRFELWCLV